MCVDEKKVRWTRRYPIGCFMLEKEIDLLLCI